MPRAILRWRIEYNSLPLDQNPSELVLSPHYTLRNSHNRRHLVVSEPHQCVSLQQFVDAQIPTPLPGPEVHPFEKDALPCFDLALQFLGLSERYPTTPEVQRVVSKAGLKLPQN